MKLATLPVTVSAQDGMLALGKAHTRLPKVAVETVPMFIYLNTDVSRPGRVDCRRLPFSTPLSFRRSVLLCSGLSMVRKFLKPLSTSALPNCRPHVLPYPVTVPDTGPHNVISPTTLGSSNSSYAFYLPLCASNGPSSVVDSGNVSSPFPFCVGYVFSYVCYSGPLYTNLCRRC